MKRTLFFLFLLLTAGVARAESYLIERIEVAEGTRVPIQIVRAEVRMTDGRIYTDEEIENAVARIRRLPFVFSARYELLPATMTPNAWILRIFITDVGIVSTTIDAEGQNGGDDAWFGALDAGIEGRYFLPGANVLEGSLDALAFSSGGLEGGRLAFTWRGYDFGDPLRAFASVTVEHEIERDADRNPHLSLAASAGVPVTRNQSLILSVRTFGFDAQSEFSGVEVEREFDVRFSQLLWVWDTTNDPYFARRGGLASFGPSWSREYQLGARVETVGGEDPEAVPYEIYTNGMTIDAAYAKYFPFASRATGILRVEAGARRADSDQANIPENEDEDPVVAHRRSENGFGRIQAGLGYNFFDRPDARVRQRVEAGVGYVAQRFESDNSPAADRRMKSAFAGWTLRHPWVLVRLTAVYDWE